MRIALAVACLCIVATCGQDPDGELVGDVWVGDLHVCAADDPPELTCERLIACAGDREWPDGAPALRSAVVFDRPIRLRDGTLINSGGFGEVVVFTLVDGARVAVPVMSTDNCPAS